MNNEIVSIEFQVPIPAETDLQPEVCLILQRLAADACALPPTKYTLQGGRVISLRHLLQYQRSQPQAIGTRNKQKGSTKGATTW